MASVKASARPTLSQFFWATDVGVRTTLLPLAPKQVPARMDVLDSPLTIVATLQRGFTPTSPCQEDLRAQKVLVAVLLL